MKKTKFEWLKYHIELSLTHTYDNARYDKKAEIKAEVYEDLLYFIEGLENIKRSNT
ncbi:hypothetical protein FJQ98_16290 [Lysinibacillus agricola]|uniref:Nucleotidyltransferase n=1 Tax=Lysinibacillus agricola TaxID=2590012 RepID=A0ABX7ARD8_9BACI|nr:MULTISPECIES: hypothetical protein [Lysinibacillus]QQP10804.1 hypothetical protein FJQ98_16290 [Lysinibacillus agricola]